MIKKEGRNTRIRVLRGLQRKVRDSVSPPLSRSLDQFRSLGVVFLAWIVCDQIKLSTDPFLFFSRKKNRKLLLCLNKNVSWRSARKGTFDISFLPSCVNKAAVIGSRDATKENNSSFLFYRELLW